MSPRVLRGGGVNVSSNGVGGVAGPMFLVPPHAHAADLYASHGQGFLDGSVQLDDVDSPSSSPPLASSPLSPRRVRVQPRTTPKPPQFD